MRFTIDRGQKEHLLFINGEFVDEFYRSNFYHRLTRYKTLHQDFEEMLKEDKWWIYSP